MAVTTISLLVTKQCKQKLSGKHCNCNINNSLCCCFQSYKKLKASNSLSSVLPEEDAKQTTSIEEEDGKQTTIEEDDRQTTIEEDAKQTTSTEDEDDKQTTSIEDEDDKQTTSIEEEDHKSTASIDTSHFTAAKPIPLPEEESNVCDSKKMVLPERPIYIANGPTCATNNHLLFQRSQSDEDDGYSSMQLVLPDSKHHHHNQEDGYHSLESSLTFSNSIVSSIM